MHSDNLVSIQCSSNCPNIKNGVKKIKHALDSYVNLAFLIPSDWKEGDSPPKKFLIFFDDIMQATQVANYLHSHLLKHLRHKIKWFNADMTFNYKQSEMKNLQDSKTWGYCITESFGMGMDISDIELVLQWCANCKLTTLWQWFG
ncbi:hypothetical protein J3A83DRAFT_4099404 [Scleroderma citrinum]